MSIHLSPRQNYAVYCIYRFIGKPRDIIVIKRIRYLCAGTSIWLLMTAFSVSNNNFGLNVENIVARQSENIVSR
jgi:hypothetical protein